MAALKKNQTKSQPPITVQNFPIVGIGASAGGLDAFKRVLSAITENSGMAYVLVQHLDPTHESILPEILQRVTKIPVHEITDDIHLAPNNIYVIPANKMLLSTDGILKLSDREEKINLSIDVFFTSLAQVHKECAIGIVLSGTGSDGTLGLKAIKEHGGISIAQDSESAAYESMPQSAVNAGVVDFVLTPEEIPAHLLQINNTYEISHFFKEELELSKDDEHIFKQILSLLRQRSGVDFTYYKQPTFHRRIARRIAIVKKKNLADYLKFLRSDKAEQDALFQDVLIPVTSFFRDPKTFQALCESIFPTILKNKAVDEPIRIWIAGCSSGEEAYSIAICLYEFLGEQLSHSKIQIFASDISEKAIKKKRTAVYSKADVAKLSEIQIKNYFVKNSSGYEVNKDIRDICVFAPHNFLKDPPFAKIDLISCRNVLIYMDSFLQKKAFSTFHYALKENGFLLLGKSETTGVSSDLFTQVDKHEKIYSRTPTTSRFIQLSTDKEHPNNKGEETAFESNDLSVNQFSRTVTKTETVFSDFKKSAEAIMISKSPASVVIDETYEIVHIHGDITFFLQAPPGKPTHNLIKMAREGLAFELRNAIHKAIKDKVTVIKENIPVKSNILLNETDDHRLAQENQSLVTVEIIPLIDTIEPHYLIRFDKKIIPFVADEKKTESGKKLEASLKISGQNQQLEKELSQTREDMRSITEDMEAANEELQSANEELQSSNEEMQSLNEELETSKEELQSSNEELIIVNQEFREKQEQLNASHLEQLEARRLTEASEKEQKKLAKQLKLATDSAKVGIWSYDIVSSKLEWSAIHKKMWGYSEHRKNLTYEDWHAAIAPEDKEMAFQKLNNSKVTHEIYEVEYRIKRADDDAIVWIKSTGLFQYDEFDFAHTLTGVSFDITEQKRFDEELKDAKCRAERNTELAELAVIAKQQFLSNMSHEIRTPLNAIIGFTKVLMKTDLNKEQNEYLQTIKSSGNNLIILINDILDLAKLDSGKMKFINFPFKMVDSISTILHLFDSEIQKKNINLIKEYDTRIPEVVLGDSVRFNQILTNLVSNAIKFTAKGKIIVSVTLINEDDENVTIEIKVADTGIGIAEDKLATIFEKFEQASNITSSIYGGTGLGLAIVKQLIEKQRGTISVISDVNKGSTFSFTLSFKKNKTDFNSCQKDEQELELDKEIKPLKVLVVEDSKINQLLMKAIMNRFKFTCEFAENGKIAIEKLETSFYDIILMDIQMPIMNGFDATKHIRNIMNLQTPIIALTADVITVDSEKCKAIGMNDYISKPFDEKLLYIKILDLVKI